MSPARQVRETPKRPPGTGVPGTARPLTVTRNPAVAQDGTRSNRVKEAEPPPMVSVLPCSSGKRVVCVTVTPWADQVSAEGL
ncbi:hypothetical protein SHIRM173S_01501 [Streptomyces hirsutus]